MTEREIVLKDSINRLLKTCARLKEQREKMRQQRNAARLELLSTKQALRQARKSRDLWKHRALQGSAERRRRETGRLVA